MINSTIAFDTTFQPIVRLVYAATSETSAASQPALSPTSESEHESALLSDPCDAVVVTVPCQPFASHVHIVPPLHRPLPPLLRSASRPVLPNSPLTSRQSLVTNNARITLSRS